MNNYEIYQKALSLIDSCKTEAHFKCAERYCNFAAKKFKNQFLEDELFKFLKGKRWHVLKEGFSIWPIDLKSL